MGIRPQRVPQHQSVAAIVLGAGDTEAVTKAVKLLGIDGEHRKASLQQHFDHRSARRLDGHRDLARLRSGPLQEPVAQSRQGSAIMADIALGHLLALAIEQTDAMLFMRPVEADKPKELVIHPIRLHSAVGHRDACQSLYWRSRRKPPTGHPSRPLCRGTSPTQVLVARVGIGGSQQIGPPPVYQDRLRTSERVQGGLSDSETHHRPRPHPTLPRKRGRVGWGMGFAFRSTHPPVLPAPHPGPADFAYPAKFARQTTCKKY